MPTIHDGEILFREKYGSSAKKRLYVKPSEQGTVVTVEDTQLGNINNLFQEIFLPQGYPESVSKDYIVYQLWDTAQAFCSTITGILATQEVLRGVGVGDKSVTLLAATVTWVLKDGCGHIGRILFAYSHGTHLDAYSKNWRLYADTLNDAAMCMELALPLFKQYTTFILCLSTVMKSIVGVAGGATRVAMTQHHALRGNLADVSAKDAAQETAVNLIASLVALMIITFIGQSVLIFAIFVVLHIIFNYLAVRAVCLRTLNEPRFLQVIDAYLRNEIISSPCEINLNEPIVFYQMGTNLLDLKLAGFKIKLGQSIQKAIPPNTKASHMKQIQYVYQNNQYILLPSVSARTIYVVFRDTATTNDIFCAYFHAVIFSIAICTINDFPLAVYKTTPRRPFGEVCAILQEASWSKQPNENDKAYFKINPTIELMKYLNKIVLQEWDQIRVGLLRTGWDLSKHLLVVDEWRVNTAKVVTEMVYTEKDVDVTVKVPYRLVTFDSLEGSPPPQYDDVDFFTIEPEETKTEPATQHN